LQDALDLISNQLRASDFDLEADLVEAGPFPQRGAGRDVLDPFINRSTP
jgi:hypothetical protein